MSRFVVTNAGPLMVFSKLNVLHLFKELYGILHFTQGVFLETVTEGMRQGAPDAHSLQMFLKQHCWSPTTVKEIPADLMNLHLDLGERESIALALPRNALLLMDEERGRAVARNRNLQVKGSLGVMVEAFRGGLISFHQIQFYFQQIAHRPDIWISPSLCKCILDEISSGYDCLT